MPTLTRAFRYCTGRLKACHWLVAGAMLAVMLGLSLGSMIGDSAIVDEMAHVPAAYSYVHYGDYRLNPEHPPLMKVLAGIPLQFLHLNFPQDQGSWDPTYQAEWTAGWNFLYNSGNDAGEILFWARLPILLVAIVFGAYFYRFLLRRYGVAVALLGLFFYVFSPNIIAHARYVTTDLGATVFIFAALVACARFMERPGGRGIVLLSLGLAAANLAKASGVVLYPFLGLFVLLGALAKDRPVRWQNRLTSYVGGYLLACLLSVVWIWLAYIPEVWHMSRAVQQQLIHNELPLQPGIASILTSASGVPGLEPLVQWGLGLAKVINRVNSGNVTYFMGQVNDQSFMAYFPVLFTLKTQVAFLILMLVTGAVRLWVLFREHGRATHRAVARWLAHHWIEVTLAAFVVFYFSLAVFGNLDLGIRHVLPVYVPLFVLVALGTMWVWRAFLRRPRFKAWFAGGLAVLLIWYAGATLWIYPNFLAYFNELIGGPAHADQYFGDSSVDWGQDLLRFKTYLQAHPEMGTVALDYFGGGDPRYYFCKRIYGANHQLLLQDNNGYDCSGSRILPWHVEYGPYSGRYIAVSETFLTSDIYTAKVRGDAGYAYLRRRQPIAKIGYSIYLYKLR